ncbi:MAG: zinc-dependent peptidase [Burkholderiales bacterium]|jgi:Mlc titration factor MtfA (ptsG expression regulator)|nr:zinc-dependent peptidase [Burkholderiales bacterium]
MNFFSRWRRERMLQRYSIPEALWQEALTGLPFLADWTESEREALRTMCVLFLCDKDIVGVRGFAVTPFQRVVVAVQACIPVLKLGLEWYDDFKTVVLCPDEFVTNAEWEDENGVVHRDDAPIMGETMLGGPVVLSWPDALDANRERDDDETEGDAVLEVWEGDRPLVNVVIHEFVHKLDMKNGDANGCPPLPPELPITRWQQVMKRAYDDFCRRVDAGENFGIDPYASEHPAEFFAVLSETFFVAPVHLREAYPDVYECFRLFYRWSPMWTS